jgi:hypothetical protein
VQKYRESELKHGRLAMLACVGFLLQEIYHPIYPSLEGLSIYTMEAYREVLPSADGLLSRTLLQPLQDWFGVSIENKPGEISWDYYFFILPFVAFEAFNYPKRLRR